MKTCKSASVSVFTNAYLYTYYLEMWKKIPAPWIYKYIYISMSVYIHRRAWATVPGCLWLPLKSSLRELCSQVTIYFLNWKYLWVCPLTWMGWDEMFNAKVKTLPSALLGSFPCISIGESIYHGKRGNYLKELYCRAVALWKPWQSNWIWLACKAAREINKRRGRKWGGGPFTFLQWNIPSSDCL